MKLTSVAHDDAISPLLSLANSTAATAANTTGTTSSFNLLEGRFFSCDSPVMHGENFRCSDDEYGSSKPAGLPSSIEPERDGSVQNKEKVAIEGSDGTGRLPRAASPAP